MLLKSRHGPRHLQLSIIPQKVPSPCSHTKACLQIMQSANGVYQGSLHKRSSRTASFSSVLQSLRSPVASEHLYLAQSTMWSRSLPDAPLAALMQDLQVPACLADTAMQEVNLWLSSRYLPSAAGTHCRRSPLWSHMHSRVSESSTLPDECMHPASLTQAQLQDRSSRSSLHYDCHANLLCVVTGHKAVHLMHPDATPCLYPLPLWGQSSNHSAVDFSQPDPELHPRFEEAQQAQCSFQLQAGPLR